jgi:hypothetical protein
MFDNSQTRPITAKHKNNSTKTIVNTNDTKNREQNLKETK